jgi:hypothetical protein
MFGINSAISPDEFQDYIDENLSDFRGGWACASSKKTQACYSHSSDITELDVTDDSISLIVNETYQVLVASCGVFDLCDDLSQASIMPFINSGDIMFPIEAAKTYLDGEKYIIEFEGGALTVDPATRYVQMYHDY